MSCPTAVQIETFLSNPVANEQVATHLERCTRCNETAVLLRREIALLNLLKDDKGRHPNLDEFSSNGADDTQAVNPADFRDVEGN